MSTFVHLTVLPDQVSMMANKKEHAVAPKSANMETQLSPSTPK
jgi:hypothetical protein